MVKFFKWIPATATVFLLIATSAAQGQGVPAPAEVLVPGTVLTFNRRDSWMEGIEVNYKSVVTHTIRGVWGRQAIEIDEQAKRLSGADMWSRRIAVDSSLAIFGFRPILKFPLPEVGGEWESHPSNTGSQSRSDDGYRHVVVGKEILTLGGTQIETIKVVIDGWYNQTMTDTSGLHGQGRLTRNVWYAPALGYIVKYQHSATGWRGRPSYVFEYQLVSAELPQSAISDGNRNRSVALSSD